jgi:hypothetical protein
MLHEGRGIYTGVERTDAVEPSGTWIVRYISMSQVSFREVSPEVEIRDGQSVAACTVMQPGQAQACARVARPDDTIEPYRLSREQMLCEAVLLSFCDPLPHRFDRLRHLSGRQWRQLLYWLDISGLALYFLDRLGELHCDEVLPEAVRQRLQQNLTDNTERTHNMIAESVAIQREFQELGFSYAAVKGFSLCPTSVPRPQLRHQLDLDFLIAEENAPDACRVLERRGYRLYAISGKSWEFKRNERPSTSLKDLYKDASGRAVELHVESDNHPTRLRRVAKQEFYGISMPVLSPVDLFLGQGLHAFKGVCSAFLRIAHLLEFRRHVLARYDDDAFWRELRAAAGEDRRASWGIGVVTYLITSVMGQFAPEALTSWTVATLPSSVRLWVDVYGRRVVFGRHPGTKRYLLLQQELESAGILPKRSAKRALLPLRLPPVVIRGLPDEKLPTRISRYRLQLRVILSRLRFHVVEGLRYALESRQWRRHVNRLTRG